MVGEPCRPVARGARSTDGCREREWRTRWGRGRSARCTGLLRGSARRARGEPMVCRCLVWQQFKVVRKVLRAAALCNTTQERVKPVVSLVHPCPLEPKQAMEGYGGLLDGQKLWGLAALASGVHISYFIVLNKTLYSYSYTFNLYFWSQVLERSMGLHTCAINTIRLDCKLAMSTARDKDVYQKAL